MKTSWFHHFMWEPSMTSPVPFLSRAFHMHCVRTYAARDDMDPNGLTVFCCDRGEGWEGLVHRSGQAAEGLGWFHTVSDVGLEVRVVEARRWTVKNGGCQRSGNGKICSFRGIENSRNSFCLKVVWLYMIVSRVFARPDFVLDCCSCYTLCLVVKHFLIVS